MDFPHNLKMEFVLPRTGQATPLLLVKGDTAGIKVGNVSNTSPQGKMLHAPFFFWSLDILFTSFVNILGAIAMDISSWKSSLQA